MSEKIDRRVFTNTYVTGLGRQNYLNIDYLEDPLFTSFTFDIDFTTSPLFYTINYSNYGYPNADVISEQIESSLKYMYENDISQDQGYDILPLLSAFILDGNKLGFGIQQNVYTDKPLYGATEYIYMVDKRNGGANQNDARYDSNRFFESGGDQNSLNSYKLGDSVTELVTEADREWAENNKKANEEQIEECNRILGVSGGDSDSDGSDVSESLKIREEHESNKMEMDRLLEECNKVREKVTINGEEKELTEPEILKALDECNGFIDGFEQFKREIVDWANGKMKGYQNEGTSIYMSNECYKKAVELWKKVKDEEKCKKALCEYFNNDKIITEQLYSGSESFVEKFITLFKRVVDDVPEVETNSDFLDLHSWVETNPNAKLSASIKSKVLIEKFKDKLDFYEMYTDESKTTVKGYVYCEGNLGEPAWLMDFSTCISHYFGNYAGQLFTTVNNSNNDNYHSYKYGDKIIDLKYWDMYFKKFMTYTFDYENSFNSNTSSGTDTEFSSQKVKDARDNKDKYDAALSNIRFELYGLNEETKSSGDINNPSPNSKYGQYLEAKKKYENDDYSQAERTKSLAQSGATEASKMLSNYNADKESMNEQYNQSVQKGEQPSQVSRTESIVSSQTVLDMLGFISGMKNMTQKYPYIIQGVTGLDVAYNKHYGIKDPYLGSGEDKITLTCLESLDLRVSSMFNRYFNAVYDRQYRRERVPVNLRRFNCSIYVHDVRNFVAKSRFDKYGDYKMTYNRILELTDMYYSVIEFRFFDCEIVPEETGNIFNDISNEAPSDMKKTNFTFTYGNCVVNFVPQSEVSAH